MSTGSADTSRDFRSRTHDTLAAGIGVIALALLIAAPRLVDSSGPDPFYKGPLIFPLIALALTALGSLPAIVRLVRFRGAMSWHVDGHGAPWRAIAVLLLMCFFPEAIRLFGLLPTAFAFILSGLLVAGYRRPLIAATVAAAVAVCLHLAFITFLDIWFPEPEIRFWFGV